MYTISSINGENKIVEGDEDSGGPSSMLAAHLPCISSNIVPFYFSLFSLSNIHSKRIMISTPAPNPCEFLSFFAILLLFLYLYFIFTPFSFSSFLEGGKVGIIPLLCIQIIPIFIFYVIILINFFDYDDSWTLIHK